MSRSNPSSLTCLATKLWTLDPSLASFVEASQKPPIFFVLEENAINFKFFFTEPCMSEEKTKNESDVVLVIGN